MPLYSCGIASPSAARARDTLAASDPVAPPAAYWAAQRQCQFVGVVVAGTLGSYLGATAAYWVARWLGRPLLLRYGKFVFCPEDKVLRAERWLARYEVGGVFFAR